MDVYQSLKERRIFVESLSYFLENLKHIDAQERHQLLKKNLKILSEFKEAKTTYYLDRYLQAYWKISFIVRDQDEEIRELGDELEAMKKDPKHYSNDVKKLEDKLRIRNKEAVRDYGLIVFAVNRVGFLDKALNTEEHYLSSVSEGFSKEFPYEQLFKIYGRDLERFKYSGIYKDNDPLKTAIDKFLKFVQKRGPL